MTKPDFRSFIMVFRNINYIILFLLVSIIFLFVAAIIPSFSVVKFFIRINGFDLGIIKLIADYFIANSTVLSRFMAVSIALLSGINFSMLIFYLKRRITLEKKVGTGVVGMILGLLGIGCASCGSIILSSIFGFTATVGFLGTLPLKGVEFGLAGIFMLLISIYLLSIKIQNPLLCKISNIKH